MYFDPDFAGVLSAGERHFRITGTELSHSIPGITPPDAMPTNITDRPDSTETSYIEITQDRGFIKHIEKSVPDATKFSYIYNTSDVRSEEGNKIEQSQKSNIKRQIINNEKTKNELINQEEAVAQRTVNETEKRRIKKLGSKNAATPIIPQFLNIIPSVNETALNIFDTETDGKETLAYRQDIGNKSLITSDITMTDIPDIRITQDPAFMFWKDEMPSEQIISDNIAENFTARDITYTAPQGLTRVNRNLPALWDSGNYNTEESSPKPDMLYHIKPDALSSGIIRNTAGILRREEAQETRTQIPQMTSLPNVAKRAGDYASLFYHNRENLQGADNNMQLNTATTASRSVQTPLQTVPPKQVEHKTTSFNKVDMSVKKPPGMSSDITMDPVQMNKLVNQVYEQLERKIFHERRRMGL
jgi:hypothetical protein